MTPTRFAAYNKGVGLTWAGGPPRQSQAGDARSLGAYQALGGLSMPRPRPGTPEPLGHYSGGCNYLPPAPLRIVVRDDDDCGCGCGGGCGGRAGAGVLEGLLEGMAWGAAVAAGAYLLGKMFRGA